MSIRVYMVYSPPQVDRIWGTWGSYYDIPKAIFYLLTGDCRVEGFVVPNNPAVKTWCPLTSLLLERLPKTT